MDLYIKPAVLIDMYILWINKLGVGIYVSYMG